MAERRRSARNKTAKEIAAKVGCSERTVRYWWSMPRAEYEANSIARAAPWEALGMSRATWYRKGKPMSASQSEQAPSQETQHATNSHPLRERELPA
jgi:transcriptional regulator with XRE-family HTH domain